MAKLENHPQIQSLGSKLNMFDWESPLYFDSTWKHTLCTIKFILKEFYLFKKIHIYINSQNFLIIRIDIISCNIWNIL